MILKTFAVCAAMLVALGPAASADTFQPAKRGTFSFDLDTDDGAFSIWKLADLGEVNVMKVRMTFLRKGKGEYAPTVSVRLLAGAQMAVFQFLALPKSGPLIGYVYDKTGSKGPATQLILTGPEFKETFDVFVSWTPEGKVTFDFYTKANKSLAQGFERHEINIGAPVTGLEVSNSTSEIEFSKLELGTMVP